MLTVGKVCENSSSSVDINLSSECDSSVSPLRNILQNNLSAEYFYLSRNLKKSLFCLKSSNIQILT